MYPESNTLPKQPYPVRFAAGLVDFAAFCGPVKDALVSLGVPAEISGRNDMTIEGKKFSGNAQYIKDGRIMHHGTILYDSDLRVLSLALQPGKDKIESRGIKSVQSRVTNVRPYMKTDMPISGFWKVLKDYMIASFDMQEFQLTPEHLAAVEELNRNVYSQWSWNYGISPPYSLRRARRVEGCGKIEIFLDVSEGKIKNIAFYGDFFGNSDPSELGKILTGLNLEEGELKAALKDIDISQFFHGLDTEDFIGLLF
jgi:lipoate-protein ligase A